MRILRTPSDSAHREVMGKKPSLNLLNAESKSVVLSITEQSSIHSATYLQTLFNTKSDFIDWQLRSHTVGSKKDATKV
jgi:hypothetical protein